MPRINFEEKIYSDARFQRLLVAVGDLDTATGAVVRAWTLAQKYYLTEERMVPVAVWEEQNINPEVIKCGLAVIEDNYVRVRGADEHFAWLLQCQTAGRKSSIKRAAKRATTVEGSSTTVEGSPTSSSFSFSSSSSFSKEKENTSKKTLRVKSATAASPPIGFVIGEYKRLFETKYGSKPDLSGKPIGQIKNLLKTISAERLVGLIETYLAMDDDWIKRRCHDFGTFVMSLQKVGVEYDKRGRLAARVDTSWIPPTSAGGKTDMTNVMSERERDVRANHLEYNQMYGPEKNPWTAILENEFGSVLPQKKASGGGNV